MKIALTLIALAAGLAVSPLVANWVVRQRPGETVEEASVRIGRRVVSGMVATITTLIVMVAWLSDNIRETDEALDVALEAVHANCISQEQDWIRTERGLIADVRLATATYNDAVQELQDLVARRDNAEVPDASALGPIAQEFIDREYADALIALGDQITKANATVSAFEGELKQRQDALDAHRAEPVSCPPGPLES